MSFDRLAAVVLVAAASVGVAAACGPDFPWQLLDDRVATVTGAIGLDFSREAARLAPKPKDKFAAVEQPDTYGAPPYPEVVLAEHDEAKSGTWDTLIVGPVLSPDTLTDKLDEARRAVNGKDALAAGDGLPAAVLAYIAGAVEFNAGRFETAAEYFESIGRLPADRAKIRIVAATYMLGRIHQQQGELDAARAAFQAVREQARAGAPDPMGLAVASLGEEARIDLAEAGFVTVTWPIKKIDKADKQKALIVHAVQLYSEQAALGSKWGLLSLHEVADRLCAGDSLERMVGDPLIRRLVVAFAVERFAGFGDAMEVREVSDDIVTRVADAVLAHPDATGPDVDRLATLAYLAGRYEIAEKLTTSPERPLGRWIHAKLALQRGDRAQAIRDFTAALADIAKKDNEGSLDGPLETRLRGEVAVMKLSTGDYQDSMKLLFPMADTYWGDLAYVAERVLTVDELKSFVDGLPAVSANVEAPDQGRNPVQDLRALLARRLVREGRLAEAIPYFPQTSPAPDGSDEEDKVPLAQRARDYKAAVEATGPASWWHNVSRAEALFKVAVMTRQKGMELMGTEGPPDMASTDGAFSFGYGQASPWGQAGNDKPHDRAAAEKALIGPDEERRATASEAVPDKRFHYRVIAADKALAAADLLPERSQAYAATLCWAARFAKDSDDDARAGEIYRRYVKTGAYQPWAKTFGGTCPQPDFKAADWFWAKRIASWPGRMVRAVWRHLG